MAFGIIFLLNSPGLETIDSFPVDPLSTRFSGPSPNGSMFPQNQGLAGCASGKRKTIALRDGVMSLSGRERLCLRRNAVLKECALRI
jgi:hypothetical protein